MSHWLLLQAVLKFPTHQYHCCIWVQVNATSGTDMEYIFSHSTFAGYTGYTDDPWGANQVRANN